LLWIFAGILKWTTKANKVISGLKVIRRLLDQDQFLLVASPQNFGGLYFALPVWYGSSREVYQWRSDTLYFKLLRVTVKNWQRLYPRDMLDTRGRSKPSKFALYLMGSLSLKVYKTKIPSRLYSMITNNEYSIRQTHRKTDFYYASRRRIGRQAISNRINKAVKFFDNKWKDLQSKHEIE